MWSVRRSTEKEKCNEAIKVQPSKNVTFRSHVGVSGVLILLFLVIKVKVYIPVYVLLHD